MRVKKNVFVLDLDEALLERLRSLEGAGDCEFHGIFHSKMFADPGLPPAGELLRRAEEKLSFFNGSVDAVMGFRGFPVDVITAMLARNLDLPGLPPSAVLKCEHRYWSRLELQRAFELHPDEAASPRFARVDWGSIEFAPLPPFEPPLLLKPVLLRPSPGSGEPLEVRVLRGEEFTRALRKFGSVPRTSPDLDYLLELVDAPTELLEMRGEGVYAEEWVRGSHHRVDAWTRDGETTVYGIIDTHWDPRGLGVRFEYPSRLPERRRRALGRAVRRISETFGLEGGAFAADFVFRNGEASEVPVAAAVSPGISSAFSGLYERVDGRSGDQVAFDLALRRRPEAPAGGGPHAHAARFLLHGPAGARRLEIPPEERIREIERETGAAVRVFFDSGFAVADRYVFGAVEIGAGSPEELVSRYREVVKGLGIRFPEAGAAA